MEQIAKDRYEGKLKKGELSDDYIRQTFKELHGAAKQGYGDGWMKINEDTGLPSRETIKLQQNLWKFSGAKNYAVLEEINRLMTKNGKPLPFNEFKNDLVFITDSYEDQLNAILCVEDTCLVTEFFQTPINYFGSIENKLIASDLVISKLTAHNFITDHIYVDDSDLNKSLDGFAWTANTDTWAMSRYDSYQFHDLTVIDGVVYGINDSGVFRVDADSEVDAKIITGQLDIGQGQLVHPIAAYLEYQLSGNSKKFEVGVSTTQGGAKQTYHYPLQNEQADYLTNGRVLFGRGLRGRHFSFEFKISGQAGYINDLSIDVTPTKRRV